MRAPFLESKRSISIRVEVCENSPEEGGRLVARRVTADWRDVKDLDQTFDISRGSALSFLEWVRDWCAPTGKVMKEFRLGREADQGKVNLTEIPKVEVVY
jgi:hypothetical protein